MGLLPPPSLCFKSKTAKVRNQVGLTATDKGDCSNVSTYASHLAPGAESLLKKLPDGSSSSPRFNINRPIREMTVTEWAQLLRVFDDWPFAPEVCYGVLIVLHASDHEDHPGPFDK